MPEEKWVSVGQKWKESVLQIIVTRAFYNPLRPYSNPEDQRVKGSGFIVDISRGLVVTNAHVMGNAIVSMARMQKLGQRDLSLKLLGICREKDIALCALSPDDIAIITYGMKNPADLNMKFGDNMQLTNLDQILVLGFPMGDLNFKATLGVVSGFKAQVSENDNICKESNGDTEDSYNRSPTYIQITAPLNPGNSGGPCLNKNGQVVGVAAAGILFAQNIGYAIGSRTIMSIFKDLLNNEVVLVPTLGLKWNRTNRDLMRVKCGSENHRGIYVRKILPDSCLNKLENGDIITHLQYEDPFWLSPESFSILQDEETVVRKKLITCFFDRFGDITIYDVESDEKDLVTEPSKDAKQLVNRKLSISEVVDMIPVDSKILLQICRGGQWYKLLANHRYVPTPRLLEVYPKIDQFDFEIFSGLCCTNLLLNQVYNVERLSKVCRDDKKKYQNHVVITQVFPGTSVAKTQVFQEGDLIREVNGQRIFTLEDLRKVLSEIPSQIHIETMDRAIFIAETDNIIDEDLEAISNFSVNTSTYRYLLKSN